MRDEQFRTLEGHWESLQTMLARLELSPKELRNMKRAFYSGAVSMMTVMKVRVAEFEDEDKAESEGPDLIQELTREALQGMVDTVTAAGE